VPIATGGNRKIPESTGQVITALNAVFKVAVFTGDLRWNSTIQVQL